MTGGQRLGANDWRLWPHQRGDCLERGQTAQLSVGGLRVEPTAAVDRLSPPPHKGGHDEADRTVAIRGARSLAPRTGAMTALSAFVPHPAAPCAAFLLTIWNHSHDQPKSSKGAVGTACPVQVLAQGPMQ